MPRVDAAPPRQQAYVLGPCRACRVITVFQGYEDRAGNHKHLRSGSRIRHSKAAQYPS